MTIHFNTRKHIPIDKLEKLYNDVEWYAYTENLAVLQQALLQSLDVISAWDGDELIGLVRIVGDGLTIIYVQDILILNAYQNQGIATKLMDQILNNYKHVRQKVLLTEEAPDVRHFYEKNGFESCDTGSLVAFALLK